MNLFTKISVVLLFMITSSVYAQEKLDGQHFEVKILEKNRVGQPDKMKDVIIFKNGTITAKFSKTNGFSDATYTTTSKDGMITEIITFKGSCKSKKDDLVWEGVVNGDEIEGTATRSKGATIKTIYEFKGSLKD